jgi:alpha-glucosidase
MPYIYSGFYTSTQVGMPLMRSLAIDYSTDASIYDPKYQQQYMFGPAILVAPVKSTDELTEVYLPVGKWFDLFTDKVYDGKQAMLTTSPINKLPLFVKAGSIIPMQKLTESIADNPGDTLMVHIFKGMNYNQFIYYEDDGETYSYSNGDFYKRSVEYIPNNKIITIIFHDFNSSELKKLNINKSPQSISQGKLRYFTSHFKFADYGPDDTKEILKTSFPNSDGQIVINW